MGKTNATGWHLRNDSCGIVLAWLGRIGGYALVPVSHARRLGGRLLATSELPAGDVWWVYAVGGIVAILFGLALILWPHLTVTILIVLFGAFAIIDSIVRLFAMFWAIGAHTPWWPHLVIAIIDIAAGVFVLTNPELTAVILLYVIAFWAIVAGVVELVASLAMAKFPLLIIGLLSIVFGFVLLGHPTTGALALVLVIGIFAIVRGIMLLIYALGAPAATATPS